MQPREPAKSKTEVLQTIAEIAAQPPETYEQSEPYVGTEVLRRPRAKYVLTTNEGPPSRFICWHNEYAASSGHPGFVEGSAPGGLAYLVPHTANQAGSIVGGNGFWKAPDSGPTDGLAAPDSEEAKRKGVERRVLQLAERGCWHANVDTSGENIRPCSAGASISPGKRMGIWKWRIECMNYTVHYAPWAWEDERKILASF
ncbi:hypothetical protein DL766_010152 [Monosporascus sp. MC13-8B]|uniref:Uncharacterized protein n=1 Tax=Monosporascus cannonballus TaxID=155416 RepID=A0ABY0H4D3_9PEZI|nr:hypothetical protein DL762_007194 [Monosporascus cannonballus]RYO84561.1 hypothetical protein DL763_007413 [Monosporascus cannonballus]RYP09263.1 hypothetical protein DL766_010152 [Monosporascus sp. MC13-8B]